MGVRSLYRINSYLVGKSETSAKCLENIQGQVRDCTTAGTFNSRVYVFTWSITWRCLSCWLVFLHDFRCCIDTVLLKNGGDKKIVACVNITYLIAVYRKRKILVWVHKVQGFGQNRVRAMHWAYIYVWYSSVHLLDVRKDTQGTYTLSI